MFMCMCVVVSYFSLFFFLLSFFLFRLFRQFDNHHENWSMIISYDVLWLMLVVRSLSTATRENIEDVSICISVWLLSFVVLLSLYLWCSKACCLIKNDYCTNSLARRQAINISALKRKKKQIFKRCELLFVPCFITFNSYLVCASENFSLLFLFCFFFSSSFNSLSPNKWK